MPAKGVPSAAVLTAQELRRGRAFLVLRVVQLLTFVATSVVVARVLEPAGRAQYAVAFALAMAVWAIVHLSLDESAGRALARRTATEQEVVPPLAAAGLCLALVGVASVLVAGLAGPAGLTAGAGSLTIALAATTVAPLLAVQYSEAVLMRSGSLTACGVAQATTSVGQLGLVVMLAAGGWLTPETVMMSIALALGANALMLLAVLARSFGPRSLLPRWPRDLGRRMLQDGLALHPSAVALQVGARLDLLLVSLLTSAVTTGLYSLAVSLSAVAYVAAAALSQTALRAQTHEDQPSSVRFTAEFARQGLIGAAVVAIGAAALAYPLVSLVYGPEWRGAVLPLVLLLVAMAGVTIETPLRRLLMRTTRPSRVAVRALIGAGINLALTAALVPLLGISGAALATLAGYWWYAGSLVLLARRDAGLQPSVMFRRLDRDDLVPALLLRAAKRHPR